jgi:hypothetical protein
LPRSTTSTAAVDEIMLSESLLQPADPEWVTNLFEERASG